jgi:hypothetical protein
MTKAARSPTKERASEHGASLEEKAGILIHLCQHDVDEKKIGIYRNLRINAIAGPEVSQEFSKVRQSIVDELRN